MSHLSSGDPSVWLCVCVCVCGRMGPSVCQDGSSFGHSLSTDVTHLSSGDPSVTSVVCVCMCVCVCVGVWVLVCVTHGSSLHTHTLSQMSHIFHTGDPSVTHCCVCTCVVCVCVCVCVCVGTWVHSVCHTHTHIVLWHTHTVKMSHLSSGDPSVLPLCVCV